MRRGRRPETVSGEIAVTMTLTTWLSASVQQRIQTLAVEGGLRQSGEIPSNSAGDWTNSHSSRRCSRYQTARRHDAPFRSSFRGLPPSRWWRRYRICSYRRYTRAGNLGILVAVNGEKRRTHHREGGFFSQASEILANLKLFGFSRQPSVFLGIPCFVGANVTFRLFRAKGGGYPATAWWSWGYYI